MKKEYDDYLVAKYPKIFANRNKSEMESCMYWGFEHGNGWFWLLDRLCKSIQGYIDNNPHLNISQVVADQVKEKFGSLSFYYSGGDKRIDGMVSLAENMSEYICEKCGSTKEVGQTKGWITTLCKECAKDSPTWKQYETVGLESIELNERLHKQKSRRNWISPKVGA